MAALTIQEVTATGISPAYTAAAGGGDTFAPTSPEPHILHVKNGGGGVITVTINDPISTSPAGATAWNPDAAISVTNGQERMIEVDPGRFVNPANGNVEVTYSGVTTVTVGVFLARR